jgi:hypothetical protein
MALKSFKRLILSIDGASIKLVSTVLRAILNVNNASFEFQNLINIILSQQKLTVVLFLKPFKCFENVLKFLP